MLLLLFLVIIVSVGGVPLQPGQPGGEWSQEEVAVVRDKVWNIISGREFPHTLSGSEAA